MASPSHASPASLDRTNEITDIANTADDRSLSPFIVRRKPGNKEDDPMQPKPSTRTYETKVAAPVAITPIEYGGLQDAFDYLNSTLFDGTLPNVFITYQRRAHSGGYFSPARFANRLGDGQHHEIALNPDGFLGRTDEFIVSILLHEMVHLWQHVHGKPPSRAYHDKQWSAKMETLGLMPSSTGMVGGKRTGQSMSHYIAPDGPFTRAFAALAATGWKLNLESAHYGSGTKAPPSKVKFTCPSCGQNAWGKPDLAITCTPCGIDMQAERTSADAGAMPVPLCAIEDICHSRFTGSDPTLPNFSSPACPLSDGC
jgi:predicted SprT family Zn-dependent metalloprotease